MEGKFITFEGSEGCGKSTQSRLLYQYLKKEGFDVIYLREPGGVKLSERIRRILLDPRSRISKISETLLYMASRSQLVEDVIRPALKRGKIVVCDRFLDSTFAYQGFGLGVDLDFIKCVGDFVTQGIEPNLTIFLDLPVKKGMVHRQSCKDRIENRDFSYHNRVRRGYLKLASLEPKRIKIIKVHKEKNRTQEKIRKLVQEYVV